MTLPGPSLWPLSAAATTVLRDPGTRSATILRLALRELVVRDVLRLGEVRRHRFSRDEVVLRRGPVRAASLPPPLPELAAALLPRIADGGTDAAAAVRRAVGWRDDLPGRLRRQSREALQARGLLEQRQDRMAGVVPVRRWRRTQVGEQWVGQVRAVTADSAAVALPAVGLLLALDRDVARSLRDRAVEAGVHVDDATALDAVLGDAGDALDGAADSGSGGDGDGGGGD